MKTARFLLACAVASVLAACGSDPITAPATDAHRAAPRVNDNTCVKVTVVNADGTTSERCADSTGSQMGTGN